MSGDLVLRPACDRCGSSSELYGSNCKHLTLCFTCGKAMAQNRAKCNFCFVVISRLIRDKSTFTDILKKISKIQKTGDGGPSYVVLRDK